MESLKLAEPIPITSVNNLTQAQIIELLGDGDSSNQLVPLRAMPELEVLLGLDDLPIKPTTYRTRVTNDIGNSRFWHVDGGDGFFDSPAIAVFANTCPTEVLQGEIPVYCEDDWKDLKEDNPVVEAAIKTGTARIETLMPNIYYLLRSPTIHRAPELTNPDMIRLFGRWME